MTETLWIPAFPGTTVLGGRAVNGNCGKTLYALGMLERGARTSIVVLAPVSF